MEFADAINGRAFGSAVDLTRHLRTENRSPLVELAAVAISRTFFTCVTGGEHAAEHQFSAIHGALIQEVVLRVRAFDAARMDRTVDAAADCFPDQDD